MSYKVLLAQDVSQSGKDVLKQAGYEVVIAAKEDVKLIKEMIVDCDAVFSKTFFLSEDILAAGKTLKVVAKHGVGVDNVVSVDTATKLGILVVRTPLANMNSVAEHIMAAMLALAKNIVPMDSAVRRADFNAPERYVSNDISGKILGIIGCGNIGRSLAQKASQGFGMQVLAYDPFIDESALPEYIHITSNVDDLLKTADYVSLNLAAAPMNNDFINLEKLQKMKPTAFLLNFSRGSNVNEKDLIFALKTGLIKGAALDVFTKEPVEKDNPLLSLPNVLLSPHCAALTVEAMDLMSCQGAMGIVEALSGQRPRWCLNYDEVISQRAKP